MVQRQGADNNINIHTNQLSAAHPVPPGARNPTFSHSPVSGDLIPRDYLGARSDGQALCSEVAAAASPQKSTPTPLRTNFRLYQGDSNLSQSPLSPKSVADTSQFPNRAPVGRIAHAAFPALPSGTSQILSSASGVTGSKPSGGSHQHERDLGEQINYMKLRTASDTTDLNQSPTSSPISRVSSLQSMPGDRPLGRHMMPRTSSIDSAISSLSSTSQSHKPSFDANALSQADIENLISTAGSAEAVIVHLLKEKHHAASQNAQLWKLVDKQRTLILGLNKDLDRAMKEKERYKKKVKELQSSVPPLPSTNEQFRAENTDTPLSQASSSQGQAQSQTSSNTIGVQRLALDDESVDSDPSKSGQEEESEIKSLSPRPLKFSRQEVPTASPISLASSSPPINETLSGENRQQGVPPSVRKAPPAPLNLGQPPERAPAERSGEYDSESEYEDMLAVEESPVERGRRKTRDDDDRTRELEVVLGKEETLGSSEKENPPFNNTDHPGDNPHSVFTPQTTHVSRFNDHVITITSPKSPGLPLSPRPEDRPLGSPMPRLPREIPNSLASMPMSSSNSLAGLALSPRLPKHPFASGAPTSVLAPIAPLHIDVTSRPIPSIDAAVKIDSPRSPVSSATEIYQGLMSEDYPNLLLPPNALPLIQVKVSSSRLRPSRLSYMAPKPLEEEPVFTLSIFSRSNLSELWRVEKIIAALPQLDQQMRQLSAFAGKLPDRSIFSGHSPAKVDARRAALNSYFETLLDTPMDEKAALIICQFLTSDAIEPRDDETSLVKASNQIVHEISRGPDGRPRKEGYLTKRGKNFGGWKSRYFTLQGPELKYFESPGGAHLGTIKIYNAQIGKQSQNAHGPSNSSSGVEDDTDNQYRHAFLILEPKKKDSSALVRHVLCAESDEERDAWVEALLEYVEGPSENESPNNLSPKDQSQTSGKQVPTAARSNQLSNGGKKNGKGVDNPELDATGAVQGFSFDDAVPAEPPLLVTTFESQTPRTPLFPPTASMGPTDISPAANTNFEQAQPSSKAISAPTNGTVIQDVGAWGNKTVTSTKEKKRSIWGFRTRSSYDLASQLQASHDSPIGQSLNSPFADRRDFIRPVFGIPLAEAVHFCPPQGVDSNLPAVVYRCIEYLQAKEAASEEGIFRLSGSNVVVKGLRERFNTEGDVDFLLGDEYYDVHAIASLFKQYLRELPTTVLTRELHLEFLRVLELDERHKKIMAFNALVHRLPKVNLALLRALVQFLIVIVKNSDVNKMTIRNVGIVFAPTLNIPAPVFSMFLTDYESIFDGLPVSNVETADQLTDDKSMSPEDIRSPRRQMFSDIPTPAYNQTTFRRHGEQGDDANIHHETGFISMQPSYDQASYNTPDNYSQDQPPAPVNRMLMPISESARTTKAQRRESSLLFMELSHQDGSVPAMHNDHTLSE